MAVLLIPNLLYIFSDAPIVFSKFSYYFFKVTSIRTDRKKKTGKRGKSLKKARNPDISDMDSVTWETESVDATSFKSKDETKPKGVSVY